MSKFYLVEFRHKRQRRWRPWLRSDGKPWATSSARRLLRETWQQSPEAARVCRVDTDAGTVTVCWEGRR